MALYRSLAVLLTLFLIGCQHARGPAISEARRQQQLESFDQIWTTINDQHWDPNLNGVDWDAARAELRPRVAAALTDGDARKAMQDLIERLHQSHFHIIPAEAYSGLEKLPTGSPTTSTTPKTPGDAGVTIRLIDGAAIVTRVRPDSAAAAAGVLPGWELSRVDKLKVTELLKKVRQAHAGSTLLRTYESLTAQNLLDGDEGETVTAEFRDGRNRSVVKQITLCVPAGTPSSFLNLPTMYTTFESREVGPGVGYIAFNAFLDPQNVSAKFKQAIERFEHADGLIIDLRGNPGGLGIMANGMAGYLVGESGKKLGEMTLRNARLTFAINPQPTIFTGPVAVLVDECSLSTSEILAGGLQDLERARIFGTPTPGAALPSRIEKLPNGDGFQFAFANYTSARGDVLEGHGVQPDEIVRLDRKTLLEGRDQVIEAAVRWIGSQKKVQ